MTDWYTSSTAYAAIPAFVASHAYSIGNIVKPTAPALKQQWTFRCTTAGTSGTEPNWSSAAAANNATVTTGGATFANVTAQSAYGWGAAAGDIPTLLGEIYPIRFVPGDRMFVSSDHSETQPGNIAYGTPWSSASYTGAQILSVNRAGSVPPVAADLLAGATITVGTGGVTMTLEAMCPLYYYGISFVYTGTASQGIVFNSGGVKTHYFDTCQLYLNTVTASVNITNNAPALIILANSTLRFGNSGQAVRGSSSASLEITWLGTAGAIAGATIPLVLFGPNTAMKSLVTARGVDLSAITGALVQNGSAGSSAGGKYLFDSCRVAPGVTRLSATNMANTADLVELVNCYDGTNIINESYQPAGVVTTERTITLSGGATDDVGVFSHKLVSGTNIDKYANTLLGFWMDVENTVVGSSKTATVEIISSLTLNNDDISLLLEYQGTTGSSVASFANTLPANVLTTNAAVTASTATWNSSPATPQKQKLVVTFTPQVAGRVRGQVRLGRASTTAYVNPLITIA